MGAAINHREHSSRSDAAEGLGRVAVFAGQLEPQHIHRRAEIFDFKTCRCSQYRSAPVGCDHKIGAYVDRPFRATGGDAGNAIAVPKERIRGCPHQQAKCRQGARLRRDEIEEIPLRHESDEFADRRQMPKIRNFEFAVADPGGELIGLAVRKAQKLV